MQASTYSARMPEVGVFLGAMGGPKCPLNYFGVDKSRLPPEPRNSRMESENFPATESAIPTIAVLTCDRPRGFYVGETIAQIDRQGGKPLLRRLYVDGTESFVETLESRLRPYGIEGWEIVRLGEGLGSTEAMRRLIVKSSEEARDLLFFEDDLLLCRNAVKRMISQQVPDDAGIVTFFDMKEVSPGAAPGIYRRPTNGRDGKGFWGAQCLRIHKDSLVWMANRNWADSWEAGTRMASDILMGRHMEVHPTRNSLGVHIPNLIEHVGHASACFPGLSLSPRWRQASNFRGREFDAMSLAAMS